MGKGIDRKIEAYKHLCRLAEVPELFIEYPELIFSKEPTKEDIIWAKEVIVAYENKPDING